MSSVLNSTPSMDNEICEEDELGGITDADDQPSAFEKKALLDYMHPRVGIILSLFGVVSYISDVGSDIWLALDYLMIGHIRWGAWTAAFVCISLLVQCLIVCGADVFTKWERVFALVYPIYL